MTDDELGRAAASALKTRFPEPDDVDLMSTFHTPGFGQLRTTVVAVAASVVVVAGVSTGVAFTSGHDHPSAAPGGLSPGHGAMQVVNPPVISVGPLLVGPSASSPCTPSAADVTIRLGGTKLRGNTHPVRATVPAGHVVRVVARYGIRKLTLPSTHSTAVNVICRSHGGHVVSTYFRAVHTGTATVTSRVRGCSACMEMEFVARIHIARHN
jgi:hypothetical protein